MGEGACVLLLEELESARARGATIYAEVLGYGASNDAHHMAQPDPDSVGVAEMMRAALRRADVEPERVGYVNAHGTSTPLGDAAETRAIKEVFGDHAYELAVSSTKSMTGHCFGAAGAIEAMMCVLALKERRHPADDQLRDPDPECDLDYVPNEARRAGRGGAVERDGPRRPQRLRPRSGGTTREPRRSARGRIRRAAHDAERRAVRAPRGRDAREDDVPQMMVGEVEGRFLEFLVRATGARRVLELGTFTGYSSISMARGLPRRRACDRRAT